MWCPTIAHLPRRSLRNKFISWFNLLVVNWVYPGLPGLGRITILDLNGLQSWIWTDHNPFKSREKGPQLKEATPRGQFIYLYSHGGNSKDCGVFPCGATHSQLGILSKSRYM